MEHFLDQVRAYAAMLGDKPGTVVQRAGCGGGSTWAKWESGASSPTLHTADKLLRYIADNPPPPARPEVSDDPLREAS